MRLALTFHGRKGLPIVSRISLLDSRFLEYQNVVIGTVQTTLNAGIVFVTLFPNFNMSLKDPHLCDALKVQVQITGAFQVQDTFTATLHYQFAYRLQNHDFDMAVPDMAQSNDALLIQVDPRMTPMCTFVPRQLNRDQITSLFPESWIMKYEMLHQVTKPIQSNDPFVIRKPNGKVEIRFLTASPEKKDVTVFPIQIAMLQPVSYVCENGLKIKAFEKMESLVMKVNHLLVTYGGIFVIVLIAEKKFLKKIIQ